MTAVAICSWSLRPRSPEELAERALAAGVSAVQLALDPVRTRWGVERTRRVLAARGIRIVSGMMAMEGEDYSTLSSIERTGGVRPDATWPKNAAAAAENAAIARALGLKLVTFHAGFLPEDPAHPEGGVMLGRLRALRDTFAAAGVRIALETGQERAGVLLSLLAGLEGIGVNFDPANIILYGTGDPVAALVLLAPHIVQVHIKDARPSATPGEWGVEVPVGEGGKGGVDWDGFFGAFRESGLSCDLVIEREAGDDRVADVARARALLARHGFGEGGRAGP